MGFSKETNSQSYIGWISLKKRKPNPRIEEIFSWDERPDLLAEQEKIKLYPYVLHVCELSKEAYENDDKFPENSDYRISEVSIFKTLEDVDNYLKEYNKSLSDIKWMSEIPFL